MSAKNMFAALLLGAFMCVPVAMNADCGNKSKAECAKEASKEDGMACCKRRILKKQRQIKAQLQQIFLKKPLRQRTNTYK